MKPRTPDKIQKQKREVKRTAKEFARDLILNDRVIQVGLVASGLQLTYAFAYGDNPLTWVIGFLKAAFVEITIWNLNRAIAWAGRFELRNGVLALWGLLVVVMIVSSRANLQYEHELKIKAHNPSVTVFDETTVDKYLTTEERIDSWLRGGLLPMLVLGLILARRTLANAAQVFETSQTEKLETSEKAQQYRARIKSSYQRRAQRIGLLGGSGRYARRR